MAVIAVTKETRGGETRVAATPETVKKLAAAGWTVVVEAGAGIGPVGRPEHQGVAVADGDGTAGEACKPAGLDGQRTATELRLEDLRQGNGSSLVAEEGDDLRQVGRLGLGRRMRGDPGLCRDPDATTPSGGVRAVR